jgi:hypothetical protein
MIDLKENNLPGDFRGELFMDLGQHKFQVPEPINVKEYIDSRIKEEVTAQVGKINKMIGETLQGLVEGVHKDIVAVMTKQMIEKLPIAVEEAVSKMINVTTEKRS